jgi:hypothetical protein
MDTDKLVDTVTRIIMQRLDGGPAGGAGGAGGGVNVVAFGNVPATVLGAGLTTRQGTSPSDTQGADYIVMSMAAFRAFHGGAIPAGLAGAAVQAAGGSPAAGCATCAGIDLTAKKLISERDLKQSGAVKGSEVKVCPKAIVTALARDYANANGIVLVRQ